jgi:putative membrane protein
MLKKLMLQSHSRMSGANRNGENNSVEASSADWHRVSPIAICYFLIQNIQHAINFWPLLVGALANQNTRVWLFGVGMPVLAAVVLGFAFLSYWFFRYQFDADKIQIRSGIFQKRRLILNFERVQEANLEQAIYFRPFSLWTLRLESAGSTKEEIALPGISEALAADIKQRVLFNKTTAVNLEQARVIEAPTDFTIQLSIADLVRYGLMHNTLVYFVAILAPLLTQNDSLWRAIGDFVERMGLRQWAMNYFFAHSLWVDVVLVMLLLVASLGVIFSLSIVLAIIKYWNYTLKVQGERLQYEAGLFNRVACGFRKHKLQTIIIRQGFIAGLLKRYSLEICQTNEAVVKRGVPMQGFMIPVLDQPQMEKILTLLEVDTLQWQRTLPIQIFWRTLFAGGALTAITAVAMNTSAHISPLWLALPIPLIALWCWKYWYSKRYSITENGFAVKRGLLGYSITYIPQIKVQKLSLEQGPLGHLHNHGKLILWSGAKRESIGYVDITALRACHSSILEKVSHYRGRWM